MTGKGKGYGKIILFNEHFVVYGIPAIASSIDRWVEITVERNDETLIFDERLMKKNDKTEFMVLNRISSKMGLNLLNNPVRIIIKGNLPLGGGLGASAATCVALARALSDFFKLNLDDEYINKIAYEGEKIFHGRPSGIDNTVSTYGGTIWFEKGGKIERIFVKRPLYIVIGNTGISASTKKAVKEVRMRMKKDIRKFTRILDESRKLAYEAKKHLEDGNLEEIGRCMNRNQELLREIGVSCKELEDLIKLSLNSGALGAKLTGGGLGGNMIALAKNEKEQNFIAEEIKNRGYDVIKTEVK